ncbi:RNA 2',3'-cyclic phosphodiesterase [Photobacterium minamisatsumaniensis]|uniref:RNA 2',3'-cyclic phosphodiesterase n=1 Tax=Photobacterium minamisatsumaniensis TaxID=2910233 RepID=UPI003D1029F7
MKEKKQRLFFALSPTKNSPNFTSLCQLVDSLSVFGRPVPHDNMHITLAFVGNVSDSKINTLRAATSTLHLPSPIFLTLDALGYWKRSKVLWLGTELSPPALLHLAQQLQTLTTDLGLYQEVRPYRPHITLTKSVAHRPQQLPEYNNFAFHFESFGLYISHVSNQSGHHSVSYSSLQQWQLPRTNNEKECTVLRHKLGK